MKNQPGISKIFPSALAILLLAAVIAIPAGAQKSKAQNSQGAQDTQASSSSVTEDAPVPYTAAPVKPAKEGFWGHVNPFARKSWVKKRTDPINDQLGELGEVNSKNAKDITDVDSRAQSGIRRAQSTADGANQTATAAGEKARHAHTTALSAMSRVDTLNSTVNGLDSYQQTAEADVAFRGGQPVLSAEARRTLDDLATKVSGQPGYILEVEAHSPASGAAGIQNSERLAEAVKRYLVTEHEIPVYRMHAVALGNARGTGEEDNKPVRTSSVHIRLMENSLAAKGAVPPQSAASLTGAERP